MLTWPWGLLDPPPCKNSTLSTRCVGLSASGQRYKEVAILKRRVGVHVGMTSEFQTEPTASAPFSGGDCVTASVAVALGELAVGSGPGFAPTE